MYLTSPTNKTAFGLSGIIGFLHRFIEQIGLKSISYIYIYIYIYIHIYIFIYIYSYIRGGAHPSGACLVVEAARRASGLSHAKLRLLRPPNHIMV